MRDYFNQHVPKDNIFINSFDIMQFRFNLARTFSKLVLIILIAEKFGLNSIEFFDLKGKDIFINEISGNRFEIVEEKDVPYIILDENFKLSLKKIDYSRQYKQILKSFKYFDTQEKNQIRSIFYDFKIE
jgi:hypothetical protein